MCTVHVMKCITVRNQVRQLSLLLHWIETSNKTCNEIDNAKRNGKNDTADEKVHVGFKSLQNDIDICNAEKSTNDVSARINMKIAMATTIKVQKIQNK